MRASRVRGDDEMAAGRWIADFIPEGPTIEECQQLRKRLEDLETENRILRQLERRLGPDEEREERIAELLREIREARQALEARGCLETSNLEITGIEQTQATQHFRSTFGSDNSIPLVAGKGTGLRVYVRVVSKNPEAPIGNVVSGELLVRQRVDDPGTKLSPLTPLGLPPRDREPDRLHLGETLNFFIPGYLCHGWIGCRLYVYDAEHPRVQAFTSIREQWLKFEEASSLKVRLVRVGIRGGGYSGQDLPPPSLDDYYRAAEFTMKTYPTHWIELVGNHEMFYQDIPGADLPPSYFTVLFFLEHLRAQEGYGDDVRYMALWEGLGWALGRSAVVNSGDPANMAHELGHTFGRCHVQGRPDGGCSVPPDQCIDRDYPDYEPYLYGSIGEPGWDPVFGFLYAPHETRDFMGYNDCVSCPTPYGYRSCEWTSPYGYQEIAKYLRSPGITRRVPRLLTGRAIREHLRLLIRIYRDGRTELRTQEPFHLPGGPEPRPVSDRVSPYFVELQDNDGRIREARRLYIEDPYATLDSAFADYLVAIPWHDQTSKVVVKRDQDVVFTLPVGKAAPEIEVSVPDGPELSGPQTVTWTSAAAKEAAYRLRYSPDGGETWVALPGPLESTKRRVNLDELPGGEKCLFQVIASTGVRTSVTTSRTFAVPSKAPECRIVTPTDGETFIRGQPVQLFGFARSPQRSADPGSLNWASSISGYLGSGELLTAQGLAVGKHRITLSCEERDAVSSDVHIEVQREPKTGPMRPGQFP